MLNYLWTGIGGVSVTGCGRVVFNSTPHRDYCACAHKPVYEYKKDD